MPPTATGQSSGASDRCSFSANDAIGVSTVATAASPPLLGAAVFKSFEFNGDNRRDILLRNTDGSACGWKMSGQSPSVLEFRKIYYKQAWAV